MGEGRAAAQDAGHRPKEHPLFSNAARRWGMNLNSGQTSPFNSFLVDLAGLFSLFSELILGESSRQSPRHGSQICLSSEMIHVHMAD